MPIALNTLDFAGPNVRTIPPPPRADQALCDSIAARGVLQPILVRPHGNAFQVVLGRRRARAAIALGLAEIPAEIRAMTDQEAIEAQIIENRQREAMHPIDQWKATKSLLDAGGSVEDAAMALGLDTRAARRMALLAMLHPEVARLIQTRMPKPSELGTIARASPEQQAAALKAQYAVMEGSPNWLVISRACGGAPIPRSRAIFNTETAGVAFEEDLFAEPGAPDQFVTRDTAGFLAAQTASLQARVQTGRDQGQRIQIADWHAHDIKLPPGWERRAADAAKTPSAPGSSPGQAPDTGLVTLMVISRGPLNFGQVVEVLATPPRGQDVGATKGTRQTSRTPPAIPARAASSRAPIRGKAAPDPGPGIPLRGEAERGMPLRANGARVAGGLPERADRLALHQSAPRPDPAIDPETLTKQGQTIMAAAKTAALRDHLRNPPGAHEGLSLLTRCLLVALTGDNVHVNDGKYSLAPLHDLALLLVDPEGNLIDLTDAQVLDLLGEALARMLVITDPATDHGSGAAAEYVAKALDVPPPRLDTPEFLATLRGDELRQAARAHTSDRSLPTSVAALRKQLAGALPNWRPAQFGAPGPQPGRAWNPAAAIEAESETTR